MAPIRQQNKYFWIMDNYKLIFEQPIMLNNIIKRGVIRFLFSAEQKALEAPKKFSQTLSKAQVVMPLFKLQPKKLADANSFIAPNATVIGDVYMGNSNSIGHGTVIRGDINAVYIHRAVLIGDNCVLHTASSLPSGLPAQLTIYEYSVISPGCTLYSCVIKDRVFVGSNSVILEGAIIESGAIILPNSVVPPGRIVPAGQVWGGNPIKFVRYTRDQQKFVTKEYAETGCKQWSDYYYQFLGRNNAYLYKPSDPENDKIKYYDYIGPNKDIFNNGSNDPSSGTH